MCGFLFEAVNIEGMIFHKRKEKGIMCARERESDREGDRESRKFQFHSQFTFQSFF
jgi:hypothetical protein